LSNELNKTFQRLPKYLQNYVVKQHYDKYTAREHATWRFIMRHARSFFKKHAYNVYLTGLEKTGVPISRIPNIDEMDQVLSKFGWGAVCVSGFIPPLAFLAFQAHKVLPIAADMRSLEHIAYTPAPDIVHEAAGHAPILADPDYANYLQSFAEIARKAIYSDEDVKLYEAIRLLSDVKENSDSTKEQIVEAETNLQNTVKSVTWDSEASIVSRIFWWTAEYGLIGSLQNPKIYGAGLLSSLGESRDCLEDKIEKIPLNMECTKQSYDITKPQPQLFVASDFNHHFRSVFRGIFET
jgi:phenylalanine-4-hydroxylase